MCRRGVADSGTVLPREVADNATMLPREVADNGTVLPDDEGRCAPHTKLPEGTKSSGEFREVRGASSRAAVSGGAGPPNGDGGR